MRERIRRIFASGHGRLRVIVGALAIAAVVLAAAWRLLRAPLDRLLKREVRRLEPSGGTRLRVVGGFALGVAALLLAAAAYGVLRSSLDPHLKRWLITRAAATLAVGAVIIALLWRWAHGGRRARRAAQYGLLSSPIVLVGTAIAVLLFVQRTSLSPTSQAAPIQPIDFNHQVHAKMLGLDCVFCHRTATTEADAGMPALEQCMFCHRAVDIPAQPGIQKLIAASQSGQPIDWTRVYQLPDHVLFVHEAHISAGFTCATCHGDVGNMTQVRQVRDLRMDDCVACHKQNNAPTECATCHK